MSDIHNWVITEGDFNDVFSKTERSGTWEEIEEIVKDHFSEIGKKKMQDISSADNITYGVYYDTEDENDELRLEYYVAADLVIE